MSNVSSSPENILILQVIDICWTPSIPKCPMYHLLQNKLALTSCKSCNSPFIICHSIFQNMSELSHLSVKWWMARDLSICYNFQNILVLIEEHIGGFFSFFHFLENIFVVDRNWYWVVSNLHLAIHGYKAQFGSNNLTIKRFVLALDLLWLIVVSFSCLLLRKYLSLVLQQLISPFCYLSYWVAARRARTHAQEPLFTVVIDFHSGHHHPHPFASNLNIFFSLFS